MPQFAGAKLLLIYQTAKYLESFLFMKGKEEENKIVYKFLYFMMPKALMTNLIM